jgi:hypothetical protein
MLALTDRQLETIKQAAALLPVGGRDAFLRSISNRLSDLPYHPSDAHIAAAIQLVLGTRGISTPMHCCDSARPRTRRQRL